MVFAVALGVAVVLAIDLAGNAAAGSFRSSMETLAGDNDLEVTASGGVPESVVGTPGHAALRHANFCAHRRTTPSIEATQQDRSTDRPGFDRGRRRHSKTPTLEAIPQRNARADDPLKYRGNNAHLGRSEPRAQSRRSRQLLINDQVHEYTVRGVYPDSNERRGAILMDLATAQDASAATAASIAFC